MTIAWTVYRSFGVIARGRGSAFVCGALYALRPKQIHNIPGILTIGWTVRGSAFVRITLLGRSILSRIYRFSGTRIWTGRFIWSTVRMYRSIQSRIFSGRLFWSWLLLLDEYNCARVLLDNCI